MPLHVTNLHSCSAFAALEFKLLWVIMRRYEETKWTYRHVVCLAPPLDPYLTYPSTVDNSRERRQQKNQSTDDNNDGHHSRVM